MRPDWPFNVQRLPFFYGWVIFALSTLGFLASIPGQTMGMAVFTEHFITATGLSRTELSLAYLIGTVASSLFLTRAGKWYDRKGPRITLAVAALGLALMTLSFLAVPWLPAILTFAAMMLCYFGVRFTGQGVLTAASRNVLLVWFVKRRGLVSGVRGVFVSLGFSLAPLGIAALILALGWQGALISMALAVAGFGLIAVLLVRDSPETCGVEPDGAAADASANVNTSRSMTLAQARATPAFWVCALSLAVWALFGTAITFHVVALFASAGRGAEEAFAYFFPQAIVSTTTNLIASYFVDRHPLKPYILTMLAGYFVGSLGLLQLETSLGYWVMVIGFGLGGGLWGVTSNLAFIRQFGATHLGAISGLQTSLSVFASAIGPAVFALAADAFGSFEPAVWICLGLVGTLFIATCWVRLLDQP